MHTDVDDGAGQKCRILAEQQQRGRNGEIVKKKKKKTHRWLFSVKHLYVYYAQQTRVIHRGGQQGNEFRYQYKIALFKSAEVS